MKHRLLVLLLCVVLGWSMSQLVSPGVASVASTVPDTRDTVLAQSGVGADQDAEDSNSAASSQIEGTVDPVPPALELGQQMYLETCATCHVGVPPAVMPNQTWIDLLQDTQHYGTQLQPIFEPTRLIIWQYLQQFSRSLRPEERTPYRIRNSRYFKILHPRVEFEEPVRLSSCVSCHPGAPDFNYRQLTPEWQDAP